MNTYTFSSLDNYRNKLAKSNVVARYFKQNNQMIKKLLAEYCRNLYINYNNI